MQGDIGGLDFHVVDNHSDFDAAETPISLDYFEKLAQKKRYVVTPTPEKDITNFTQSLDLPFRTFEELYCFLLVNHYGVTLLKRYASSKSS